MCPAIHNPAACASSQRLGFIDEKVADLLKVGRFPIQEIISRVEASQQETVSSISKLIALGLVRLVLLQYPWGVEFELQANPRLSVAQ